MHTTDNSQRVHTEGCLRLVDLSPGLQERDNVSDVHFVFARISPESKFFPLRVDLFLESRRNTFDRVGSQECLSDSLK